MPKPIGPISPVPPERCPMPTCNKLVGADAVRRHLRWIHEADLWWDGQKWVVNAKPPPGH